MLPQATALFRSVTDGGAPLLFRLREEVGKGTEVNAAFHKVLTTAGKACLFVASAVAGGYAVQGIAAPFSPMALR